MTIFKILGKSLVRESVLAKRERRGGEGGGGVVESHLMDNTHHAGE